MRARRFTVILISMAALLLGSGAGAGSAHSTGASASCAGAVSWSRAERLVGRTATVKGLVVTTKYARYSNGSPTFLDLGRAYPSASRFTVVIWGRNRGRFGSPERRYYGRTICVRGLVRSYDGHAEMFASTPAQIAFS